MTELHPVVQHHVVNTLGWPALRPLQAQAVGPLMRGDDALLLAPTAGGKTEAAALPLLSRMATEDWRGLSVLYVCPLRALLNNLEPRLAAYAGWLGRSAALWHGDTSAGARGRLLREPPDLLLTTPESLEAMLVSTKVTPQELFADLQAVVIDEVHAFAGDDRGWHLLAVLERLGRLAGRPIQRVGLSATVGNPEDLLRWVQGSNRDRRPAAVHAPPPSSAAVAELSLDFVGSLDNAATVIAGLHRGEKRLVFADSRRRVEDLAIRLRDRGVETYVSHSSLSRDERQQAELAFSEARNCVIVATSTLELGIDVGDLDRVVQLGAPRTVASFLQRLGRTGRRPDTTRNALFLALDDDELHRAAALLRLVADGYVEPVLPPLHPRHVLAQQLIALALQEGRVGDQLWASWLDGAWTGTADEREEIAEWLVETRHLDSDAGMLAVGIETEKRYGRKHFLELLSVFTADPQFLVLAGRTELGSVDPMVLTRRVDGPRILALGGRSWRVTHIEWRRRRVYVEASDQHGTVRWPGLPQPLSYALTDAMRRTVLDDALPDVAVSRRATEGLDRVREQYAQQVDPERTVVRSEPDGSRWWTWAGARANASVVAAVSAVAPGVLESADRLDNRYVRLNRSAGAGDLRSALSHAKQRFGDDLAGALPDVTEEAVRQLKFGDLLPPVSARATLAARAVDPEGARLVLCRPVT
jgi:ATP-dependent Lhr-like helicase